MSIALPKLIDTYIRAENDYDADTALSCFSDNATVLDEGETHKGKKAIRAWTEKTKKKYRPQFRPLGIRETKEQTIVTLEISGTFDGSPVKVDYHFNIKDNLIEDLTIA